MLYYVIQENKIQPTFYNELTENVISWAKEFNIDFYKTSNPLVFKKDEEGNDIPIEIGVEELKEIKVIELIEKLESARDNFFAQGVQYNDVILHGGNKSAIDIKVLGIDLISAGATVPVWKVKEGSNIENPTLEQLTEMLTVVATSVGLGYKAEDVVNQQINSLTDEELVSFNVEGAFFEAINKLSNNE